MTEAFECRVVPPQFRRIVTLALAFATAARGQPVVEADRVIVVESSLHADATGASRIDLPEVLPAATRSLDAMGGRIANLQVEAGGAGSFGSLVSVRGLTNTPYFSDPSLAVYFDDLPLGSGFTYPVDLTGFSSATISRGPQPGTFGRTAEGGVLVLSSPTPQAQPAGQLRVDAGNYRGRRVALEARSERGEFADASIAAAWQTRDGYVTNATLDRTVDDQDALTAAARVRVRPTKTTEVSLQLLGNQLRNGSQPLVPINGPWFAVNRGREGSTDSDFAGVALKFATDSGVGRLSSVTSYTHWTLDPFDNRLVLPPTLDSRLTQNQRAWNEELRLESGVTAAASWRLGAWFSDVRGAGDVDRAIPGLFPIESSAFALRSRTGAVFGQATTALTEGWSLTGAVRVERVERTFDRHQRVPTTAHFDADATFDSVQPKLMAVRSFGKDLHLSASIGFGTKPGGWSAYTDKPGLAGFNAEKVTSFELGFDSTYDGGRLTIALRTYDYEIRDLQIERSFNATDYLVVNAPRARSLGGEGELSWKPLTGLTLTGTLGVTRATLREFRDPFTGTSYAGRRAPYVPAYDGNLALIYRFAGVGFVGSEISAVGRTFFDESENSRFATPARVTVSGYVGIERARWRLTVHVENATDERYASLMIPGVGHQVPGSPRTYGVDAAWKW